jgi:hypothetical protein
MGFVFVFFNNTTGVATIAENRRKNNVAVELLQCDDDLNRRNATVFRTSR